MKKITVSVINLLLFGFLSVQINAQTASASDNMVAQAVTDRLVPFDVSDSGISKPFEFGLDTAWDWDRNFKRGALFFGKDQIDLVRISYQPENYDLVNGDLSPEQIDKLNWRISIVNNFSNPGRKVVMNVAADNVDESPYYKNPTKWKDLVKATAIRINAAGHNVISVGPMNEPDFSTHQGNIDDFKNIVTAMRADSFFDNITISAGNTLNNDRALEWYNYSLAAGVNEGNTHQLAGSFDSYAAFYTKVTQTDGNIASNDELHNVMEAIVASEYGATGGVYWGDADLARGELAKAVDGVRLGYAEHRPNWTAAAVYRNPDGKIQAFGGTSERQAVKTSYGFVSKDRVVYYDGYGPQHAFAVEMPGGTGYWTGQTNAERVVNVTYGEDVQPAVNGRYKIVNRQTGQVLIVAGNFDGANASVGNYTGSSLQQWDIAPVDSRVGGDFSYSYIVSAANADRRLDLSNFSLDPGANIHLWSNGDGKNQQWYFDYNEEGWFYIRSRESSLCLDLNGTNVLQKEKSGSDSQQWRFIATTAQIDSNAPSAPSNLVAAAQAASVKLNWTASSSGDVAGYTIFRAESAGGEYNTIARNVKVTSFVDNTTLTGKQYFYKIKAVDGSLNRSVYSNEVSSTATGDDTIVTRLSFDGNTSDNSVNLNHAGVFGTTTYIDGKVGSNALSLNGSSNFVQLSSDIANHDEITIATWVYYNGGSSWQRIFDFGNDTNEYMYLTPKSGSSALQFAIKNGGAEQTMTSSALPTAKWVHVAVTLSATGASMYVNGKSVKQSSAITIKPSDFKPIFNYVGRSQWPDPLLNARIDDFRVYNYALSAEDIAKLALSSDNFAIEVTGETCPNRDNGKITVTATADFTYGITVNETVYPFTNKTLSLTNLVPGTYEICITTVESNTEQCYSVVVPEGSTLTAKTVTTSDKLQVEIQSGTAPYQVSVNGVYQFETNDTDFDVAVNPGDLLEVSTAKACEGKLSKKITLYDVVTASPNPTSGEFDIYLPTNDSHVAIAIYTAAGKLVSSSNYAIENGKVHLNISKEAAGIYLVRVESNPVETIKIIKK